MNIKSRLEKLEKTNQKQNGSTQLALRLEIFLVRFTDNVERIVRGEKPAKIPFDNIPEFNDDDFGLRRGLRIIEILKCVAERQKDAELINKLDGTTLLCKEALALEEAITK